MDAQVAFCYPSSEEWQVLLALNSRKCVPRSVSVNLDRDRTTRRVLIFWTVFTIIGFVLVAGFAFADSLALSGADNGRDHGHGHDHQSHDDGTDNPDECAIPEGCDTPEIPEDYRDWANTGQISRESVLLLVYVGLIMYVILLLALIYIIYVVTRPAKK